MKRMKKWMSLILAVSLLMCSGCAGNTEEASGSEEPVSSGNPSWMINQAQQEFFYGNHDEEEEPNSKEYRDTVAHTWDGEGTLFPAAVGPFELTQRNVTDGHGILIGNYPMKYVDLTNGTETIPCGIPGCAHEDATCEAFNASLCFPANGKLYRLRNIQEEDKEKLMLSVRPLAGGEERELGVLEGRSNSGTHCNIYLMYYGDKAFLITKYQKDDPDPGWIVPNENDAYLYLTTLDLREDAFTQEELPGPMSEYLAKKGKTESAARTNCNAWFLGALNGQLYLLSRGTKEDFVLAVGTKVYYRYDTETGELTYRRDGYPDEFPGPIRVNRHSLLTHVPMYALNPSPTNLNPLMPMMMYKDQLIYEGEEGVVSYDLSSGKEELIIEASENSNLYQRILYSRCVNDMMVNQPWPGIYYQREMQDETMIRFDLETWESVPFSLEDGKKIRKVLAEGTGVLYAELETDGLIIAKVDVSQGYENCPWEKVE